MNAEFPNASSLVGFDATSDVVPSSTMACVPTIALALVHVGIDPVATVASCAPPGAESVMSPSNLQCKTTPVAAMTSTEARVKSDFAVEALMAKS